MSPALVSQDGRWWWDGHAWRSRLVEGELDLFWFASTPEWFERIALTGLIALIPIVGVINLYGWTLVAADMVKQRWRELPPAGFQYLERGVAPFVVGFVYGLVAFLVLGTLLVAAVALLLNKSAYVGIALLGVSFLIWIVWALISLYLLAAIIVGSDRLGMARALNPATLFRLARVNSNVSLHVGLTYFVASLAVIVVTAVVPGGGLVALVVLPAIYAMIVPRLAAFQVEA